MVDGEVVVVVPPDPARRKRSRVTSQVMPPARASLTTPRSPAISVRVFGVVPRWLLKYSRLPSGEKRGR